MYPTGPEECAPPECEPRVTSLRDPGPIAVFAFWGAVALYLILYFLLKLVRTRMHHVQSTKLDLADRDNFKNNPKAEEMSKSLAQDTRVAVNLTGRYLLVTGYKNSILGTIGYTLCCLFSLSCTAVFILVLWDYYSDCQVSGIDGLCFYGDYFIFGTFEFNSEIMFAVWWITAVWFFTWVINYGHVRNWFREACDLSEATTVYVWAPVEVRILTAHVSPLVWLSRQLKALVLPLAFQGHGQTLGIKATQAGLNFFVFEGMRFIVGDGKLYMASLTAGTTLADFHQAGQGLAAEEAARRLDVVGSNALPYKATSWARLFVDECFRLFHVYQYVMYTLAMWNSYLFVSALDIFVVVLAGLISIFSARRSQKAIEKVTKYKTTAEVVRNGGWVTLPSAHLVPGDVVRIPSNWLLPCDCIIIQGACVCNEATLTGEAMPVQKRACPADSTTYEPDSKDTRYTLFSSTTVLQAGIHAGDEVLAVVTATGMASRRGQLMSTIIFPAPMVFKYDEEMPIVVLLMVLYAIPCAVCTIAFQYHNGSYSAWVTKFVYCMGIVNQCLNPLLPVVLTVGDIQAVRRLKEVGIFCLDPRRVAISGKVRVFALDKTGTLTQSWLDFLGVQPLQPTPSGTVLGPIQGLDKAGQLSSTDLITQGLATCHAVTKAGADYVGNQVEVKMFAGSGWELIEASGQPPLVQHPTDPNQRLSIVRVNEFDHARRTMSVLALNLQTGELHVFCKGSFERIAGMSLSSSVPEAYLVAAEQWASEGCYVLGMSHRSLGRVDVPQAVAASRDDLESGLHAIALLLFRNELKPDTGVAIQDLKAGQVRPIMLTGDNAQCAHYIARQCSMVSEGAGVLLGDVTPEGGVAWTPFGSTPTQNKLSTSLTTAQLMQEHGSDLARQSIELAVTGAAFRQLQQSEAMEQLLFHTRIFARFAPEQKAEVVDTLKRAGLVVGMCGDGGNDCGALRSAHAGLALSDAEASLVSPFTSNTKSIGSIVKLVREGRCALHTRLACYKFLITYGLHMSVLNIAQYWYGIILSQMVFISIDIFATICLGWAMTFARPAKKLSRERPTSSLLGVQTLISVLGIWIIDIFFLVAAFKLMHHQAGYVSWPADLALSAEWWVLGDNWESTVLWVTVYFQYISCALVYSFGHTFRRALPSNFLVVGIWGGLMVLTSLLLLLPPSHFTHTWHMASEQFNSVNDDSPVWEAYREEGFPESPAMPFEFRIKLWALCMGNILAMMGWQKCVAEGIVSKALRRYFPSKRVKLNM